MQIICHNCQAEFTSCPSRPRKYCSKTCYGEAQRKGTTAHVRSSQGQGECEFCKQQFKLRRKNQRFCSATCSNRWAGADKVKRHKGGNRRELEHLHKQRRNGTISVQCCICGFSRMVEIAHIIPASKGGRYSKENTLWMCPNHHKLFDRLLFTEDEIKRLPSHAQLAYQNKTVAPLPAGPKPTRKANRPTKPTP